MKCKANCAACVKVNMTLSSQENTDGSDYLRAKLLIFIEYLLDKSTVCGVFILTTLSCQHLGDRVDRKKPQQTLQGRGPLGRGHVEFLTRKGHRPQVPGERVFRSARPCAGQVRDVASRLCRECAGNQCLRRVRSLQADVLSGQSKLQCRRDCRTGAEETRPSRPSQAPGRGANVSPKPSRSGRAHSSATPLHIDSKSVRSGSASENDRTRAGRKKNSNVICDITCNPDEPPASMAARYETLRLAALGEPLPVEARSGLVLFLRRGMWGWARTLAASRQAAQPAPSPSSSSAGSYQHRSVIQVFAAMALNTNGRRA